MRFLVACALVLALAGSVAAQPYIYVGGNMAIFFDTDMTQTNNNTLGSPVNMYLYLLNPPTIGSRGFEAQIRGADGLDFVSNAFILGLTFPPGVNPLNLGSNTNILCGFGNVQVNTQGYLLYATWSIMFTVGGEIQLGPAHPSSVQNTGMAYLEDDPTVLRKAGWATGIDPEEDGTVTVPPFYTMATVQRPEYVVVRTESQSLTQVKHLFR